MKNLIFTIWILVLSVAINIERAEGQWTPIGPYGGFIVASDSTENKCKFQTKNISFLDL